MLSLKNMQYNRNSGVSDKLIFTETRTAFDLHDKLVNLISVIN